MNTKYQPNDKHEFDLYYEGLLDRLRMRGAGVVNKLTGGPRMSGYNQGKSDSAKAIFKERIGKDIDKFLREVPKLGVADLDEFEQKYPEIAKKIACMAYAIGHPIPLSTQCTNSSPPPPPPNPAKPGPPPAPSPPPLTPPQPPSKFGYMCDKATGECKKVSAREINGKLVSARGTYLYRTLEACKKKCKKSEDNTLPVKRKRKGKDEKVVIQVFLSNVFKDSQIGNLIIGGKNNKIIQSAEQSLKQNGFNVSSKNVNILIKKGRKAARDKKYSFKGLNPDEPTEFETK
jgi:hypothetical protein